MNNDNGICPFKGLKKLEPYVLSALEENKRARKDDFILYGAVLKRLGINIKMCLGEFLANAKSIYNAPPFESVTRCRRHIQELRPELRDNETAIKREETEEDYKLYNISGIGED